MSLYIYTDVSLYFYLYISVHIAEARGGGCSAAAAVPSQQLPPLPSPPSLGCLQVDWATCPPSPLHRTLTRCCPVTRTRWTGPTRSTAPARTSWPTWRRATSVQLRSSWPTLRCVCSSLVDPPPPPPSPPLTGTLVCLHSGGLQASAELHWHPGPGHHPAQLQDVFWGTLVFFWQPGVPPS